MPYPKLKANRIIHTFLRLNRILKVFLLLFALTFDLVLLPLGAGSARPIKFARCIQRPKRAERATRKFNSSPVLGEVLQAEGYECYNAAALGQASA